MVNQGILDSTKAPRVNELLEPPSERDYHRDLRPRHKPSLSPHALGRPSATLAPPIPKPRTSLSVPPRTRREKSLRFGAVDTRTITPSPSPSSRSSGQGSPRRGRPKTAERMEPRGRRAATPAPIKRSLKRQPTVSNQMVPYTPPILPKVPLMEDVSSKRRREEGVFDGLRERRAKVRRTSSVASAVNPEPPLDAFRRLSVIDDLSQITGKGKESVQPRFASTQRPISFGK